MYDQTATLAPSPFHWNGREGHTPRWIILHGTAGPGAVSWFQDPQSQVSANYVIDKDGTVTCCVDESNAAWANGALTSGHDTWWTDAINPNLVTLSIEHVKDADDNSDPLTLAQQKASFDLIERMCERWNIPKQAATAQGGITGHYSIDPQNRSLCPNTYPWSDLFTTLNQGVPTMRVPNGWSDDGATLTAPNGHKVVKGFRDFILNNAWNENDFPLQEEVGLAHLEMSNPGLGGGTQQIFRLSMLGWTQQRGVFKEWLGAELLTLRARIH